MHLSVAEVTRASGARPTAVQRSWPLIVDALAAEQIDTPAVEQAVVATIMRECPRFVPMVEFYPRGWDPEEWFERQYGSHTRVGQRLGNIESGDGYRYRGRGFIQLTGRDNYRQMGLRLGCDLENNPDLARDDRCAARILAAYFRDRGVAAAAEAGDWVQVQRRVNGGMIGWQWFLLGLRRVGVPDPGEGRTLV